MDFMKIAIAILAVAGIVWAYPKLPYPWNYALVGAVVLLCVYVLLVLAGVPIS